MFSARSPDGDGLIDLIIGTLVGDISFYKNVGTVMKPNFQKTNSNANPFNGMNFGFNPTPTFLDVDKDGLLDAFVVSSFLELLFFHYHSSAMTT